MKIHELQARARAPMLLTKAGLHLHTTSRSTQSAKHSRTTTLQAAHSLRTIRRHGYPAWCKNRLYNKNNGYNFHNKTVVFDWMYRPNWNHMQLDSNPGIVRIEAISIWTSPTSHLVRNYYFLCYPMPPYVICDEASMQTTWYLVLMRPGAWYRGNLFADPYQTVWFKHYRLVLHVPSFWGVSQPFLFMTPLFHWFVNDYTKPKDTWATVELQPWHTQVNSICVTSAPSCYFWLFLGTRLEQIVIVRWCKTIARQKIVK